MNRRRMWLLAVAAALLIAGAAMYLLKLQSDPGPGEAGGRGNVGLTGGAVFFILLLAVVSSRRRRRREEQVRAERESER